MMKAYMVIKSAIKKGVSGTIIGGLSYVAGYMILAVLLRGQIRDTYSSLGLPVEFTTISNQVGASALPNESKIFGWMWQTAHTVSFKFEATALFAETSRIVELNTIPIWNNLMYLLPPVILFISGFVHHRLNNFSGIKGGFSAGISLAVGYGITFVLGMYLTVWYVDLGLGYISLVPQVGRGILAGFMFPLVFGAFGGFVGEYFSRSATD